MFKAMGILCILTGCVGWGAGKVGEEQRRLKYLREMILIIGRIRDEISYGKRTLPEICLILAEYCSPLYRQHFKQIYERMSRGDEPSLNKIWEGQIEQCLSGTPLTDAEKDILKDLPQNIGMQDEKLQAQSIGRSVEFLVRSRRKAEDAYENKARMILSVSVLTGVFLTILLL